MVKLESSEIHEIALEAIKYMTTNARVLLICFKEC